MQEKRTRASSLVLMSLQNLGFDFYFESGGCDEATFPLWPGKVASELVGSRLSLYTAPSLLFPEIGSGIQSCSCCCCCCCFCCTVTKAAVTAFSLQTSLETLGRLSYIHHSRHPIVNIWTHSPSICRGYCQSHIRARQIFTGKM